MQLSPCDLSPTANVTEGAETKFSLQTGVAICIMTRNLSENVSHVSYLFLPTWDFPFSLDSHRMNHGTLLLKVTVCKRIQRSFPFCAAPRVQDSFSLKAVGATRQVFLIFLFVKKQSNRATEHFLFPYPVKSLCLLMHSRRDILYTYEAEQEGAQFASTFCSVKA